METMKRKSKHLFEKSGIAKAPSKDYFSMSVTKDLVIWRSWKITMRNESYFPVETKISWKGFLEDSNGIKLQNEIRQVFGSDMLKYVLSLVSQSWLIHLNRDALVKIIALLDPPDIARLSQVCRDLRRVCLCDALWGEVYARHYEAVIPKDIQGAAEQAGWRNLFIQRWMQRDIQRKKNTDRSEQ